MKSTSQKVSSVKSTNLSVKLLNTICPVQNNEFKRSITSFQQLSNRLAMANKNFNNNKYDHEKAKQWFYDKGVNLNNASIIARQVKKQHKVQKVKKDETIEWESFQYDKFKGSSLQTYLHENQQRTAHFAIMKSFSTNNASNHMDRLRRDCLKQPVVENLPKSQTEIEQNLRDITEKQVISQLMRNYQQSFQSEDANETSMHKVIEKVLGLNRFAWFRVLYYQIQMIQYLGQDVRNKKNYILTVSLKELEKQAKQSPQRTSDFWKSVYLQYRRGGTNFPQTKNEFDGQLLQNLKKLQYQINHFQELYNENPIHTNQKDHPLQRILKQIALGIYQKDISLDNKIDQAWMILLAVAFKRQETSQRQQRIAFKNQINYFISKYDKSKLKSDRYLDQMLASLVSLGAYGEIINIYKYLNDNNSLTPINKVLFIQIFILLSSNIKLIQSFSIQQKNSSLPLETSALVKELILQISRFAQSCKNSNKDFYFILLTIITDILRNLQTINGQFSQLPRSITKMLKLNIDDLEQRDFSYLSELSTTSKLVKGIFQNVLLSAKLSNKYDYLRLADLCSVFNAQQLIEPIFIKFIIAFQLQQKQNDSLDENEQIIEEVLDKLKGIVTAQNADIFNFLTSLIELKELVKAKNFKQLSAKRKGFEAYLSNKHLIRLLKNFCQNEDQRLLDIYINYYEQIYGLYKIVYLALNSMSKLRAKCNQLVTQLQNAQRQYPALKGPRLGKFIAQLKK